MKTYRLPQLIGYIDVKRFNKSMIEFHENIDKLNDLVSVFPKLGIPVTTEVLQELCDDYEAMCDKYFGIISERILNERSAQPDGLDIENYEKEINQLKTHFNAIKWRMRMEDRHFRCFIHEGLENETFHISDNKIYRDLRAYCFYVLESSDYVECGSESFILNKLQCICGNMNELREYNITPELLPKLIKDSPNEGYVVDFKAFNECSDKVFYER